MTKEIILTNLNNTKNYISELENTTLKLTEAKRKVEELKEAFVVALNDELGIEDELEFVYYNSNNRVDTRLGIDGHYFTRYLNPNDILDPRKLHQVWNCEMCNHNNFKDNKELEWFIIDGDLVCEDCREGAIGDILECLATRVDCESCGEPSTYEFHNYNYCSECIEQAIEYDCVVEL